MKPLDKPGAKTITYYANGESFHTSKHKLTPRTILETALLKPAEDYRLLRDEGNKELTNLDEEIPVHEGERFTALFKGPTQTS